jgi:hypothetical protein
MSKPFATQTLKPARKVKAEMRADLNRALCLLRGVSDRMRAREQTQNPLDDALSGVETSALQSAIASCTLAITCLDKQQG